MTENNAAQPGQDPLFEAIDILTVAADELRHSHALGNSFDDWTGEPEAKAEYDRTLRVVAALSKLRAEGVQAGDEVEWAGYRPLLRDAIAAKDAMHEAGIRYATFGVMFPEMMRRYAAALASAPVAGEAQEEIERMAVNRYRPVPDGKFSYKVVAGDGTRSLYTGTKDSCLRVAAKLTEAFLDGAFVAASAAPHASEADEEESASDAWRRLALQFDEHRMMAKHHIHMMLANPELHANAAQEFLAAPPLSGEQVLADRIAAIAKAQADKDGGDCAPHNSDSRYAVESSTCGDCAKGAGEGDLHFIAGTIVLHLNGPLDPARVIAASRAIKDWIDRTQLAAVSPTPSVVKQSLTATQTGEKGESDE